VSARPRDRVSIPAAPDRSRDPTSAGSHACERQAARNASLAVASPAKDGLPGTIGTAIRGPGRVEIVSDTGRFLTRGFSMSMALLAASCFNPSAVEGPTTSTGTDAGTDSSGPPPGTGPGGDSADDGNDASSDDVQPMDTGDSTASGPDDDSTSTSDGPRCEPSPEVCDGEDNDCDGRIDEDVPDTGTVCDTRLEGVCAAGTSACEGGEIVCVPDVEASAEVCDGLDNDCDGTVDNGNPADGVPCRTTGLGVCNAGMTSCAGATLECLPIGAPTAEVCDGLDNDCDGAVDEGNPGGGASCSTGLLGVCSAGLTECDAGAPQCLQQVFESPEVCDGLDNDCDGDVDEGNPGGGAACVTGQPGICAQGTVSCATGPAQCVPNQPALPAEICGNGLDDDCNGAVDDNCGCSHGLCATGAALVTECDPCVTQICAVDPFCCNNSWDNACVNQVETVCDQADCVSPACAHLVCTIGTLLTSGCHPCVTTICGVDPFCCNNSWDAACVNQVGTLCELACP
jgi:hypothetical protein